MNFQIQLTRHWICINAGMERQSSSFVHYSMNTAQCDRRLINSPQKKKYLGKKLHVSFFSLVHSMGLWWYQDVEGPLIKMNCIYYTHIPKHNDLWVRRLLQHLAADEKKPVGCWESHGVHWKAPGFILNLFLKNNRKSIYIVLVETTNVKQIEKTVLTASLLALGFILGAEQKPNSISLNFYTRFSNFCNFWYQFFEHLLLEIWMWRKYNLNTIKVW